MADDLYFDGDPETDSARRHLERVLKEDHACHDRRLSIVRGLLIGLDR